jgi:hypothetical protein
MKFFPIIVILSAVSSVSVADVIFYCEYTASGKVNNGNLITYQQFSGTKFKMKVTEPLGIGSIIEFSDASLIANDYKITDCWGNCLEDKFSASNNYHRHDTILQMSKGKTLQVAKISGPSTFAKEAVCERF